MNYKDFYVEILNEGINPIFKSNVGEYLIKLKNGNSVTSRGESPTNAIFNRYINKYFDEGKRIIDSVQEVFLIKSSRRKNVPPEYIKIPETGYITPTKDDYKLVEFLEKVNQHQANHQQDRTGLLITWRNLSDYHKNIFKYSSKKILYRGDEVYLDEQIDKSDNNALSFGKTSNLKMFGRVGYTSEAVESFEGSIDTEKIYKFTRTVEFHHKFDGYIDKDIPNWVGDDEGEVILLNVKPKIPTPESAKILDW